MIARLVFLSVAAAAAAVTSPLSGQTDDWASLARYREHNARLGPPQPGERRVVFYGNSITDAWAAKFDAMFPGKPYVGRGISGQTTPQMLVRFRQDVTALDPAVVVILAGTNDIAGNTGPSTQAMIEDNLIAMTELAKANGIRVVLSSILPVFDYRWRPGLEPAPKIIALNTWMRDYAAANDVVYLDYHSAMADERGGLPPRLSGDGVHPNEAGYRVMAPLAERAIAEALTGAHEADAPTVVIVHGAWGGGWDWQTIERELRDRGRVVYRPTLTGLGERHHLASADIGLETHITDIVNLIVWEQLEDVVLVGHSYGGMVITGVAERVAERIRHLVYLDAFVPFDGECLMSIPDRGESACDLETASTMFFGELSQGLLVPPWVPEGTRPPSDVPHPAKTMVDRLDLDGLPGKARPASYIITREAPGQADSFDSTAERARDLGWPVIELIAGHNPQREKPAELADLLVTFR
jgi:lysophospholipase L1-like esterase